MRPDLRSALLQPRRLLRALVWLSLPGFLGCSGQAAPLDAAAPDAPVSSDGPAEAASEDSQADRAEIPIPETPMPRCAFVTPADGDAIADTQTYVEIETENVAAGSVAAMLVDFVPQATAVVGDGRAEFPSVALPPPSGDPVELRAEVRIDIYYKISCTIHITVTAP